jgi:hypothetical protein
MKQVGSNMIKIKNIEKCINQWKALVEMKKDN